ncbi:DUF6263 family protein [Mucilaginibacter sp. P19]|uniref:DUF4403 family protein n=1 Tax=Mucilaginibacter gossypii TaxID=551996 RepID=A0A1G8KAE3_9SPHI|nr:DUF6263 family protein [Mucilaginibacter gossypii]SDI40392.1 hypothetical protein SAMN05192573_12045 [Mucilaginibacter gossypii]
MKKYIISCVLLFTIAKSFAQNSAIFKIKYKSLHKYHVKMVTDLKMEMDAVGDEASIAEIKKNTKLPATITGHNGHDLDLVTGKLNSDNSFPFTMTFWGMPSVMNFNGKQIETPDPLKDRIFYGTGSPEGKIHIDSVSGKNTDEKIKSAVTAIINNISNKLQFPDKPMKIGETFTQEIPMAMPVPGFTNMQMNIKLVYKLISVNNDIANFDIDQSMAMDLKTTTNGAEVTISGNGKGSGKLVYSIKQNYMSSMVSNINFNLSMIMEGITFKANASANASYLAVVNEL